MRAQFGSRKRADLLNAHGTAKPEFPPPGVGRAKFSIVFPWLAVIVPAAFTHALPFLPAARRMKKSPVVDLDAAFPDQSSQPVDDDLKSALGAAFAPIAEILAKLAAACPQQQAAWQYSGRAGWYRVAILKKRRLFYLVPKRGDFRLSLILGRKAIAALEAGPRAPEVAHLLKTADRYPEGTAFSFDRTSCKPALFTALLDAKLAR